MISLDSHNKPPTWHGGKYFPAEKWSSTEGKQAAQGHAPMVLQNQWRQRYLNLKETLPRSQEATKKTKQETLRVSVAVCLWALRGRWDASSPLGKAATGTLKLRGARRASRQADVSQARSEGCLLFFAVLWVETSRADINFYFITPHQK